MDVAEASRLKLEETDIFRHGQGQGERKSGQRLLAGGFRYPVSTWQVGKSQMQSGRIDEWGIWSCHVQVPELKIYVIYLHIFTLFYIDFQPSKHESELGCIDTDIFGMAHQVGTVHPVHPVHPAPATSRILRIPHPRRRT